MDGYASKSVTVFQYHGCWWHGCRRCFTDRNTKITHGKTREETRALREAGYRVIEKWECHDIKTNERNPLSRIKHIRMLFSMTSSHHDKTKRKEATDSLTYENIHVPIFVSIGDTLESEPTHICDPDAKTLIQKFM